MTYLKEGRHKVKKKCLLMIDFNAIRQSRSPETSFTVEKCY